MSETLSGAEVRYHDFAAKLAQPGMREPVAAYLRWRQALERGEAASPPLRLAPLSINLDLTTACNYACDHCIDWDTLNSPIRHEDEILRDSLRRLRRDGLRSVILIGGGEPTLYPGFLDMVAFLKEELGLQVAVVSNGSRNDRLAEAAPLLEEGDWIRLSLDAGSDAVFQAMHRPRSRAVDLDRILESAGAIRRASPRPTLGFSFVIVWRGAHRDDAALVENLGEMTLAARRAREAGFDYISFKPFLTRTPEGAEVLDPEEAEEAHERVLQRIREQLEEARALETGDFRVLVSTNLRVLLSGDWRRYTRQPRVCHMQALRQVLSPLGVFNCPAHRGVEHARVGGRDAWAGEDPEARRGTVRILDEFDASRECREVTCLYHPVNWFLQGIVEEGRDPEEALGPEVDLGDAFL